MDTTAELGTNSVNGHGQEYEIVPVPAEALDSITVQAKMFKWLEPCLELFRNRYDFTDLLDLGRKGHFRFYFVVNTERKEIDGCGIMTLSIYPRKRYAKLFMLGGRNAEEWKFAWCQALEEFARLNNCVDENNKLLIETGGRQGWRKMAKTLGYELVTDHYEYNNEYYTLN